MITTCPITGIHAQTRQFSPLVRTATIHPIFTLAASELLAIASAEWQERLLDSEETRLLAIALAFRTGLLTLASPAPLLPSLSLETAESSIPALASINEFIHSPSRNLSGKIARIFPTITIASPEQIAALPDWCAIWNTAISEYFTSYHEIRESEKQARRQEELDRIRRTGERYPEKFGAKMADWAAVAASFPDTEITVADKPAITREYWQYIIRACATRKKDSELWQINEWNIRALLDHCIEHLDLNEVDSWVLVELLKSGIADREFHSMADVDIIAQKRSNEEFLSVAIQPLPSREQFDSALDYLKAKALYDSQQKALAAATTTIAN